MSSQQPIGNYVIISPVKDEERYLETTIHAILRQTLRPKKWIIVDDGSCDLTSEILESFANRFDWISVVRIERDTVRQPGSAVIRAFDVGYQAVYASGFDFVVKLDCDLDLPANYFECLLLKFRDDEQLGIASGLYMEKQNGRWRVVRMPDYHAVGATKMVRMSCFEQIGGFIPARGWDTVDEIRAQHLGWRTRHFPELIFHHLKPEGSGIGQLRTNVMHGEIYYLTGGGLLFFILKVFSRCLFGRPFLIGGILLAFGYSWAFVSGKKRIVTKSEANSYRQQLNARVLGPLSSVFQGQKSKLNSWRHS